MRKVLIAADGVRSTEGILSSLNNLVSSPESIILLHVEQLEGNAMMTAMLSEAEMSTLKESLKGTEHKEALDRKAEKILTHYTKELETAGFTNLKTVIKEGHPLEEILKVSREEAVDLIIVGCSSKSRLQRMVTGCVSKDLEKTSKVPVLIAKGDGCGLHAHTWGGREVYAGR